MSSAGDSVRPWHERAIWRSTAEVVGRMLRAASTWAWAQHLSADAFGVLTHAWTVNLLLAQAFSLALPALLLQKATAEPEQAAGFLRSALALRLTLTLPALLVLGVFAALTPLKPLGVYVLLFVALSLGALSDIAGHLLMAKGLWRAEAYATLLGGLVVAVGSVFTMLLHGDVVAAGACVLLGNVVGLAVTLVSARRSLASHSRVRLRLPWRDVAPWAMFGLLEQATYQQEVLWLGAAASRSDIAHFSAVFRVLGLCAPVIIVASQLLLPQVVRLASADATRAHLERLSQRGFVAGVATGCLSSIAVWWSLPLLLPFLFPFANDETVVVTHRLSWILIFWFANTPLVQVALGQGRVRELVAWASLHVGVQAALCAWFIPEGGAMGASTAKTVASGVSTLALIALLRRELRRNSTRVA